MDKLIKHPSLSANSLEGHIKNLKTLLEGKEPYCTQENIDFMICEMEKEVERIRDWCAEDYKNNIPEEEKRLWAEVDKFREEHKDILESFEKYDEVIKEYDEVMKDKFIIRDSTDFKVEDEEDIEAEIIKEYMEVVGKWISSRKKKIIL